MSIIKKILLFFSSYSALVFIAFILSFDLEKVSFLQYVLGVIISFLIYGGYAILYFNIKWPSTGNHNHMVCSVENKNDMMYTYLLPYLVFILSFTNLSLSFNYTLALLLFLGVLIISYINSDLFLFDVVLIIKGYSYYKITSETNVFMVISKENLYEKKNQRLQFELIDKNLFKYGE